MHYQHLGQYYGGHYMMDGGDWGWGIMMLLFWVAVGLIVIYAIRFSHNGHGSNSGQDSALDIAKRRYASGEISKKDFEQLKKDLAE